MENGKDMREKREKEKGNVKSRTGWVTTRERKAQTNSTTEYRAETA